ncbi:MULTISPECIES: hypothetical protein [unclassified Pseudomonas]|uniref:hypothetical protein n=1 Tax=unclassified Pseudomonas TaxID=196821 RepID=UPI0017817843|nr:hypothetical protein [Pseudomonas sp. PDM18]
MPAISLQGRQFLWPWCCRFAALAWVYLRRFGVCADFSFRPLGRVTSSKRRRSNQEGLPRTSGFSLGAKNTLVEAKFQGHVAKGHPWPIATLATSMSLNP